MKNIILTTVSISILSVMSAYAVTPTTPLASTQQDCKNHRCDNVDLNTLNLNGHSNIRHSTIKDKAIVRGHAVIDDSTFGSLNVYGHTEMDEVHVAGETLLHGHADIEKSKLNQLTVYGHAVIDDTDFTGPVTIYGEAHFDESNLSSPLTVYGQKVILDDTNTHSINIHTGSSKAPLCLFLKGKTAVTGDINVTGNNPAQAYVIQYRRATVSGKISGANVVKTAPQGC